MIIKCMLCGMDSSFPDNSTICRCTHCGHSLSIPAALSTNALAVSETRSANIQRVCEADTNEAASSRSVNVIRTQEVSLTSMIDDLSRRARILQSEGEWKRADMYFDIILDLSSEYAPAYIGKLCVKLHLKHENELAGCGSLYSDDNLWIRAKRAATAEQLKLYQSYESTTPLINGSTGNKAVPNSSKGKQLTGVLDVIEGKIAAFSSELLELEKKQEEASSELICISHERDAIAVLLQEMRRKQQEVLMLIDQEMMHSAPSEYYRVGNTITFGRYRGVPIKWLVLDASENKRVLLSYRALGMKEFNQRLFDGNRWKTSYIRTWLNGTFFDAAFNADEKLQIIRGATGAKVYLLSTEEALDYFKTDEDRICFYTEPAKRNKAGSTTTRECQWWLRSPGSSSSDVAFVDTDGMVDTGGRSVSRKDHAIRPAIVIRIRD